MKNLFLLLVISIMAGAILTSCSNEPKIDTSNPFFTEYNTPFGVPPFDKVHAAHYMPAFEKGMAEKRKELDQLLSVKDAPTFANTIEALDRSGALS